MAPLHPLFRTQIEGNRLTPEQVKWCPGGCRISRALSGMKRRFAITILPMEEVERLGTTNKPMTEEAIQRIHGWVMTGKSRATPYRDGQNVIRDSRSQLAHRLRPPSGDVPVLMRELLRPGFKTGFEAGNCPCHWRRHWACTISSQPSIPITTATDARGTVAHHTDSA